METQTIPRGQRNPQEKMNIRTAWFPNFKLCICSGQNGRAML